jgi:hypothetical protein
MAEMTYNEIVQMHNQKQDKIAGIKRGLFTPGEGQNGDIGICLHNGRHYLAIKSLGQWFFAEALKATELSRKGFFVQ